MSSGPPSRVLPLEPELLRELRARGELTRLRLIHDVVLGAVVTRSRRQRAAIAAGLLSVLLLAGVALGAWTDATSAPRHRLVAALAAQTTPAVPNTSACEVGGVTQCSVAHCTVFVAQAATARTRTTTIPETGRRRTLGAVCVTDPRGVPSQPVLVATPATRVRRR